MSAHWMEGCLLPRKPFPLTLIINRQHSMHMTPAQVEARYYDTGKCKSEPKSDPKPEPKPEPAPRTWLFCGAVCGTSGTLMAALLSVALGAPSSQRGTG